VPVCVTQDITVPIVTESYLLPLLGNGESVMRTDQFSLKPMIDKLTKHSLLKVADQTALINLPHRLAKIDAGQYIVRIGDQSQNCCVVLNGFTFGSRTTKGGNRFITSIHMKGDLVDLAGGIMSVADCNVQALTRAEVAYIPHEALLDMVTRHPDIGRALWRDTLTDASMARGWLVSLGRRNARQRMAHFICEMARRQQDAGIADGIALLWPFTQEQVADAVGLTAVHVNRTIQVLRSESFISLGKLSLTITDPEALHQVGEFQSDYLRTAPQPLAA
jgi:CRP-like cAMP-binding protein